MVRTSIMPPVNIITDHLSALLAEASRLHGEAMSCLDKPERDPLPRLLHAQSLLADATILTSDVASYLPDCGLDAALAELHKQHGQVGVMIAFAQAQKHSLTIGAKDGGMPVGLLTVTISLLLYCAIKLALIGSGSG